MRKLIKGIAEYRRAVRPAYREMFAQLALRQKPDALLIACSYSRVAPNLFASTDPGDVFVVRNVGNLIPPHPSRHPGTLGCSESAALEFSVFSLEVKDIIVCGHSECGAMNALINGTAAAGSEAIQHWLRYGSPALQHLGEGFRPPAELSPVNQLSQANVLQQLEHILSYPELAARVRSGALRLHGWWFDIAQAEVLHFDRGQGRFVVIDEAEGEKLLAEFI